MFSWVVTLYVVLQLNTDIWEVYMITLCNFVVPT